MEHSALKRPFWVNKYFKGLHPSSTCKAFLVPSYIFFFFLLYNIVLVLPYINMNAPWVYTCSPSWTPPSHLPPCTIPLSHPSAPAPSILYRTWAGDLFHIWYYTCFNAILPNHPTLALSHRVQMFFTSVSLLLSRIKGYHYHHSKFHIYVLVYCIGIFLSGLLHSV